MGYIKKEKHQKGDRSRTYLFTFLTTRILVIFALIVIWFYQKKFFLI